jgi:glycosyltransferase involved in cell wall biosynthesis
MKTCPRFSVILCTFNRCNLVLSTLASLRRQTLPYSQFEVIVVDNGSIDGTFDVMRNYVSAGKYEERAVEDTWQVSCLFEPRNGLAYARNTGLQAAHGEVAVFLHDDAIADQHLLEHLLIAYEETGADVIGGRVELDWELPRPHWLSEELLEVLGYFAPSKIRTQLEAPISLSSTNFSIKIETLRAIGGFSYLFNKSLNMPLGMEMDDLCYRLRNAGYALWYEPQALVAHRAPAIRLARPFFIGRAYWQGRSEVLLEKTTSAKSFTMLHAILPEIREVAYLALLHRPLLGLAGRSTNERLLAAMEQARNWGRLQQRLHLPQQLAAEIVVGARLFVRPAETDQTVELLTQMLMCQGIDCRTENDGISLTWLWKHRLRAGKVGGTVHLYHVGAFNLNYWRRLRFNLWFWLAQRWGLRIVTSDPGGWWQSTHSLRFRSRRVLENKVLSSSDVILASTRQPERLYPDRQLHRRVRCLPHPGFRGYYKAPEPRDQARQQLGLPKDAGTVYLCFASVHTEKEVVRLIEAFLDLRRGKQQKKAAPQLLLVGLPADKSSSTCILRLAALNPSIHLNMAVPGREDVPLYMGAVDVVVLPHFAKQTAGMLEMAMLAYSYGRVVVIPSLPRFRGMLPSRASIIYDPANRLSLIRALFRAQKSSYHLNEKEAAILEAESGWQEYTQYVLKLYQR